jgi:glycosyltransferase EpsH
MDSPLISIILPIYNAEEYLDRCLESILEQTYENIEVVCVNDGSSDAGLKIVRKYFYDDERIIILDKKNEGVSKARNAGLNIATGEFIMFVDADDWIERNTCKTAIEAVEEYHADIVMWSYVSETDARLTRKKIFQGNRVFESNAVKEELYRRFIGIIGKELAHPELADALCPVWGKLYRKSVIEKSGALFIDLENLGTYEDGLFNLQVFGEVNKAVYLAEYFYHYRRTGETSVTSGYRATLFEQWQNLFQYMQTYIDNKRLSPIYQEALNNRIALSLIGLGLNIISAPESVGKKINMIREILNTDCYKQAYRQLEMRYFPIHWKLFFGCAKLRFSYGVYGLLEAMHKIISK